MDKNLWAKKLPFARFLFWKFKFWNFETSNKYVLHSLQEQLLDFNFFLLNPMRDVFAAILLQSIPRIYGLGGMKPIHYYQFVIFNPWKVPWNWVAFSYNSFVIPPDLIRRDTGCLANEAFFSILNIYTCKHKIYNHQSYIYLICLGIKKKQ